MLLAIVRRTIPQALFGRENDGTISGALAGPALLEKAAGPLVTAAVVWRTTSSSPIIAFLLIAAIISLACYFSAIKLQGGTRPSESPLAP